MTTPIYNRIGAGYAGRRRADPRIASALRRALGPARSVVNVGAGTGSYEPVDLDVTAVEPSVEMLRQRSKSSAPAVQASAESLPFDDNSFDAALAILTVHHWSQFERGLGELRRVARDRVVILTWDPQCSGFWLTQDYFPDIHELDTTIFPRRASFMQVLGECSWVVLPVPHDCSDGFLGAFWRRPRSYLDPSVRSAMSSFGKIDNVQPRLDDLTRDIASGYWHRKNHRLVDLAHLDVGYRIATFASGTLGSTT